jgi:hypothetical protein
MKGSMVPPACGEWKRSSTKRCGMPTKHKPLKRSGWWRPTTHSPGKLPPRSVDFYSNGRLDTPESVNTWMLRGNQLVLCWYTPQAKPFGVYVDTCTLSKDGKFYQGRSLAGAPVNGEKISGDHLKAADRSKGRSEND